jgi:hypothetical protein
VEAGRPGGAVPASVQVCKATARSIIELNIGPSIIHRGQLQFKVTPARAGRPKRDARLDAQVPNSLLSHTRTTETRRVTCTRSENLSHRLRPDTWRTISLFAKSFAKMSEIR